MIEFLATLADMERLTGMTYKAMKKRLGDLQPVKRSGAEIFYDLRQTLPLIYKPVSSDTLDLTQQRARLAKAQAEKTELETQRLRGQLVDVAAWSDEFGALLVGLKDSLKNMGLRLADQLVVCQSREEIYETVNLYTSQALNELATAAAAKATTSSSSDPLPKEKKSGSLPAEEDDAANENIEAALPEHDVVPLGP